MTLFSFDVFDITAAESVSNAESRALLMILSVSSALKRMLMSLLNNSRGGGVVNRTVLSIVAALCSLSRSTIRISSPIFSPSNFRAAHCVGSRKNAPLPGAYEIPHTKLYLPLAASRRARLAKVESIESFSRKFHSPPRQTRNTNKSTAAALDTRAHYVKYLPRPEIDIRAVPPMIDSGPILSESKHADNLT